MHQFIQNNTYKFGYQIIGQGEQKMLAFHGYGQDSSAYTQLIDVFPDYTIYSIDLFFHGQSEWFANLDSLNKTKWKEILNVFFVENQFNKFDVLGFSMGGKLALITTNLFPEKINRLYLLAPDGIEINAWYRVATQFSPLQGIFRYFTHSKTDIYRKLVKKVGKFGLLHKSVLKLAEVEMSTPQKRKRVYQTWMLYRFLEVDIKEVALLINTHKINTYIVIGKYDGLIGEKTINRFTHLLDKPNVEILDCGHHRLIGTFREKLLKNHTTTS